MFKKLCDKLVPADIIACIVIIGALILKFSGADGTVSVILLGICSYYFGKQQFYGNTKIDKSDASNG
jgi:hypothetical protein